MKVLLIQRLVVFIAFIEWSFNMTDEARELAESAYKYATHKKRNRNSTIDFISIYAGITRADVKLFLAEKESKNES